MKDKLKAVIEEVWRRKFGHASLSTELWNVINALKTDLFKEIDALEDEGKAGAAPEVRFHDIRAEADPITEPRDRKDE